MNVHFINIVIIWIYSKCSLTNHFQDSFYVMTAASISTYYIAVLANTCFLVADIAILLAVPMSLLLDTLTLIILPKAPLKPSSETRSCIWTYSHCLYYQRHHLSRLTAIEFIHFVLITPTNTNFIRNVHVHVHILCCRTFILFWYYMKHTVGQLGWAAWYLNMSVFICYITKPSLNPAHVYLVMLTYTFFVFLGFHFGLILHGLYCQTNW